MAKPKKAARLRKPVRGRVAPAAPQQDSKPDTAVVVQGAAMSEDERIARLDALGKSLEKTRRKAVEGRANSGIEDIWREDDEFYEGIDDANRNSMTASNRLKPPGQLPSNAASNQSTEFPNITAPYVDAAAARVGDILLPTDAKGWSIKPTPIPELIRAAQGGLPIEVIEGLASIDASEEMAVKVAQAEMEAAQALLAEAKDRAARAEKRIEDWQIEGQYQGEVRKAIESAARLGTGVLKGPIPVVRRQQAFREGELIIEDVVKPVSKEVDVWNCFPDPACGSSIHNGNYHWERGYLTEKQLEQLRSDPSYIGSQIDLCLVEGPTKRTESRLLADGNILDDKDLFEVWYYYGFAKREDLLAAGEKPPEGDKPVMIPAAFTMVNGRVIKGALNHLDTGEFPYDYFPWSRRKNSPWGYGVARKGRSAQRMVVAATRVMLTNAGRAAGPIVIMKSTVKGANGRNDVEPWKVYYASADDSVDDVRKAFAVIEVPDRQQALQAIVNLGMKMAEDITGLPMLLQGQTGSAPDTYGGQQLVDRNATGVLRRIARTFDDCITEPHIRRYYVYLLLYGPEDVEKGEFVVDARGSTALVERAANQQEATSLLQASLNPRYGLDPRKTMAEKLRADNRNPTDFQYTDEEWEQLQQQQSQQQPDPKVQVAQIKAQSDEKRDAMKIQADSQEREKDRNLTLVEQEVLQQIEAMKVQGAREISFDELKAMLASTTMKLRVQQALSSVSAAVDLHKHDTRQVITPPTEPAGRAPPGQAFQR